MPARTPIPILNRDGGSTPPSCRDWVASIAAMQRSLKPQSTGQHRGDPPFQPAWLSSDSSSFVNCRANPHLGSASLPVGPSSCSRSSMYRAPRFERGGCRRESCRECQFTGMWFNPNSRGSRLRIWQPWGCNSLHAHQFTAPGLRGNSRPQQLKIAEPSGCKSRGADQPSLVELRFGKPACG